MDLLGWLIFLFALMFSIMLHETGHFVTAKKFGMKCTRYFIGFGPTVWSTWRGETEYGVKALPVGGFVKIVGMTSIDEVEPADEPRSFRRAPGWQRLIVLATGSFMHFVLATVLIVGLALGIGIENQNTTKLAMVESCLPANAQAITNGVHCTAGQPKSPAIAAGLKAGDVVTSFNGVKVSTWTQLTHVIEGAKPGATVPMTVERDGRTVRLSITPGAIPGRKGAYLGIVEQPIVFEPTTPLGAIKYTGTVISQTVTGTVSALGKLPAIVPKLFSKNRSATPAGSVASVVGLANDTGQAVAANVGWQVKVNFILLLIASLNIFIGILNMLPLLPMDGGHFAVVLWEMIRSWFARRRRRPDPGLVDYRKLIPVSFGVFMILVFFGVLIVLADIVNPVNIG